MSQPHECQCRICGQSILFDPDVKKLIGANQDPPYAQEDATNTGCSLVERLHEIQRNTTGISSWVQSNVGEAADALEAQRRKIAELESDARVAAAGAEFYKLTVLQRDSAWRECEALRAELDVWKKK